jgi:tetratricopeptide (TPR) repeat protein
VVRLPSRKKELPVSGTVSVAELSRKIPGSALKEGREAEKKMAKGEFDKAIAHLQKATGIFPDFAAAHNDLGLCYSRLQQRDAALEEFERAARLDPGSAMYASNLSAELLMHGKYAEAESPAREALKLDPASDKAHYLLGVSLTAQKRSNEEALRQLEMAAKRIPEAMMFAADVLARTGRRAEAIVNLRRYLELPGSKPGQATAREWLNTLEHGQ